MDRPCVELTTYRKAQGLSLEQFAAELGLTSKGHMSDIEAGKVTASIRLALQIEELTAGVVPAESVLSPEDAKLLRETVARRATAPAAEAAA